MSPDLLPVYTQGAASLYNLGEGCGAARRDLF